MRGATPFFMALLFAATEYRAVAAQGGGGGAGEAEKTDDDSNDECSAGEHKSNIVTYTFIGEDFKLTKEEEYLVLEVNDNDLPSIVPYTISDNEGYSRQGILDAERFLDTWAAFERALLQEGGEQNFGGPLYALAEQCSESEFPDTAMMTAPSNALLYITSSTEAYVVNVFGIDRRGKTTKFYMKNVEDPYATLPEGGCHRIQATGDEHFHHKPACSTTQIADELVIPEDTADEATKTGFSMFIKVVLFAD